MEPASRNLRSLGEMLESYNWPWVETQVAKTIGVWNYCAHHFPALGPEYTPEVQSSRECAYDEALEDVERTARRKPASKAQRLKAQAQITASFARFSAVALDLPADAVELLTNDFLPVGTNLARWARQFDPALPMPDIIQASRNAWTACGLQPLLGERIHLTQSILGYSLLYPYTDNYLDRPDISTQTKHSAADRFRGRLRGDDCAPYNDREATLWDLVALVEGQFDRTACPQVFEAMLAIHRAQEASIAQLNTDQPRAQEITQLSCAKGGTSVLADACLARGWLDRQESQFAFEWGDLLQLGDDLQDVREDLHRGSATLFSQAVATGTSLDDLATQLLCFSDQVAARMDALRHGSPMLKNLLRMSWRSLIVNAVADSHQFFSSSFVKHIEISSPFRFAFLRARRDRLTSRQGLYATLFDAFLEAPEDEEGTLPAPNHTALTLPCG